MAGGGVRLLLRLEHEHVAASWIAAARSCAAVVGLPWKVEVDGMVDRLLRRLHRLLVVQGVSSAF